MRARDKGVEGTVEHLRPLVVIGDDGQHAALRHRHAGSAGGAGLIDVSPLRGDGGGEGLAHHVAALLRRGGRGDGGGDGGLRRLGGAGDVRARDKGIEGTVEYLRPLVVISHDGQRAALRHGHAGSAGGAGLIDVSPLRGDGGGEGLAHHVAALLRRGGRGDRGLRSAFRGCADVRAHHKADVPVVLDHRAGAVHGHQAHGGTGIEDAVGAAGGGLLMEARIAHDHRVLGPVADQRQRGDGRVAVPAVPGDAGHAVLHVVYGQVRAAGDGADALAEGSVRVYGQGEVGHIGRAFGQRRRRQQRHQRQSQRQQALPASHLHVGVPLLCGKYFRSMTKFGMILHILSHLKYIVNSKRDFVTYFSSQGRKKGAVFLRENAPRSRPREQAISAGLLHGTK